MGSVELVRSIEAAAYRSWPAREMVEYDGWQLRYADGFSRRGNSVYPAGASKIDYLEKLAECRKWYAARGVDLVVRQTMATESGLDDVLRCAGFAREGRTNVMVTDLEPLPARIPVQSEPSPTWWKTTADLWAIGVERVEGWSAIMNRICLPAGYAVIEGVGAGFAVRDGPLLGLFEIVVDPGSRGRGWGRALSRSLMEWGRSQGGNQAYLQVVTENGPAIKLYEGLGFDYAYSYWYRRDQGLQLRPAKSPA